MTTAKILKIGVSIIRALEIVLGFLFLLFRGIIKTIQIMMCSIKSSMQKLFKLSGTDLCRV